MAKSAHLNPKRLIVEGKTEQLVIPKLMEKNGIPWPEDKRNAPVYIENAGGYEEITTELISTSYKASGRTALGILIDADENPQQRWQSIRDRALKSIDDLPEDLPETGLIHRTKLGIRFGVWMMPDNRREGMLETFLANLLPDDSTNLWEFAQTAARSAQTNHQAPYTAVQTDKAQIYTWLAWQDPPGRQLHQALKERIFQPSHPHAQQFVQWFQALYHDLG